MLYNKIKFILNNKIIETNKPKGTILLDFIRQKQNLKGTKTACREGDCGACTVLSGELKNGKVKYKSVVSCLMPIGNIHGKHIVTIEGINNEKLTTIQKILHENAGTQCGFCTPGFVISLTGYCLSEKQNTYENIVDAVAGNICRCTGYKSIERAMKNIVVKLEKKPKINSTDWLVKNQYLPDYFLGIPEKLSKIEEIKTGKNTPFFIGGGTDIYVQKPDKAEEQNFTFLSNKKELKEISFAENIITLGAALTPSEIINSDIFKKYFPKIKKYFRLISSEQIRNTGTIAGNFVNASPIGDLSIFFLALNSTLIIKNSENKNRKIDLKNFFKDYKKIDLKKGEYIEKLQFSLPEKNFYVNFEKVSKRKHLDIASVNSAVSFRTENNKIKEIHISGGGLAPVPKYFIKTSEFLTDKEINEKNIKSAAKILLSEVNPISDIRGTKEYKKLLLRQLFYAHFVTLQFLSIEL